MKPILFNTEMACAILEGRKTVMRRVVKPQHLRVLDSPYHKEHPETPDKVLLERLCEPPYQLGQTLYVRETWAPLYPDLHSNNVVGYIYKADPLSVENYDKRFPGGKDYQWEGRWRPSIHMPREAARIFLRMTDVRVERLQEITEEQAILEGFEAYHSDSGYYEPATLGFVETWDSTIKIANRAIYGWEANPWVWVIEFERCEKSEGD